MVVHIRSFPAAATEARMREALNNISLAYMLNAPARLAMSYAHYQGSNRDPGRESRGNELENNRNRFGSRLEQLFLRYTP
jgi:hypothetical protein